MLTVTATIRLEEIQPHPQKPRLVMREDVIESIRGQLQQSKRFSEMYAPIVRRVNGHYQTISGHHRIEAARKAELAEIPCWVAEMGDDEAFMQLVLSNAQGELSPLEIGMHALAAVPTETGGRGKKGGLSAYATRIGKDRGNISRYRDAAEVYEGIKNPCIITRVLLDKAQHLAAIRSAQPEDWPTLVDALITKGWSAADTEHWVKKVAEFNIPEKWEAVFLPRAEVVKRFLGTLEFSPATVAKLCNLADAVESLIRSYEESIDSNSYIAAFHDWLRQGAGDYAWDHRKLNEKQRELSVELEQTAADMEARWNLGDWRAHVISLADESVTLLLTDPPYGIEFVSNRRPDRRQARSHAAIINDGRGEALNEIGEMLAAFNPKMAPASHALIFCHWSNEPEVRAVVEAAGLKIRGSLIWVKNNTGMGDLSATFAPQHERIIHAVKGSPTLFSRTADVLMADRVQSKDHPTVKPVDLLAKLIETTTVQGEWVADPFGGIASTLCAAKILGRVYWGCEVDEKFHRKGAELLVEARK